MSASMPKEYIQIEDGAVVRYTRVTNFKFCNAYMGETIREAPRHSLWDRLKARLRG